MSVPVRVQRLVSESGTGSGLSINWSDGKSTELTSALLRRECPCATCQEKRGDSSHQAPLSPRAGLLRVISSSAEEETDLREVWPVGNYAIGIRWGDNHDSGIFSYPILLSLAERSDP